MSLQKHMHDYVENATHEAIGNTECFFSFLETREAKVSVFLWGIFIVVIIFERSGYDAFVLFICLITLEWTDLPWIWFIVSVFVIDNVATEFWYSIKISLYYTELSRWLKWRTRWFSRIIQLQRILISECSNCKIFEL